MIRDQDLDLEIRRVVRERLVNRLQQVPEEVGGAVDGTFPAILEVWNDDRGDGRQ